MVDETTITAERAKNGETTRVYERATYRETTRAGERATPRETTTTRERATRKETPIVDERTKLTEGTMTKRVKVGDLVIDEQLTHLRPVNAVFVSRYRQAYRSGVDMPRMITTEDLRVVSGNHRCTALLQEYGPDHEVDVDVRKFASELEVLETFARENVPHGHALSGSQRTAITGRLLKEGATPEQVAQLFGVSVRRIEVWAGRVVEVLGNRKKAEYRPVKAGIALDTIMTPAQHAEHWKADRGVPAYAQAEQLTRWLSNGWVHDEPRNRQALAALQSALNAWMAETVAV